MYTPETSSKKRISVDIKTVDFVTYGFPGAKTFRDLQETGPLGRVVQSPIKVSENFELNIVTLRQGFLFILFVLQF